MQKSIFAYQSYTDVMAAYLLGKDRRGQLSRAGEFLRCQRSYLSRVIKGRAHLTPDQTFLLARFFKLSNDERDYFFSLVEIERAGTPEYRNFLKTRLGELRKKHESIQERTSRQIHVTDNLQLQYFSTWISCAVHFLTMIQQYQDISSLSERLNLKKETVAEYLSQLQAIGLVESKHGQWINKSSQFHVPKESPLVQLHHQNWRARAVLDAQNAQTDHVHYTGVHVLSFQDLYRIKDMLLNFIAEVNTIVTPSKCEEGVALTCDLFRV